MSLQGSTVHFANTSRVQALWGGLWRALGRQLSAPDGVQRHKGPGHGHLQPFLMVAWRHHLLLQLGRGILQSRATTTAVRGHREGTKGGAVRALWGHLERAPVRGVAAVQRQSLILDAISSLPPHAHIPHAHTPHPLCRAVQTLSHQNTSHHIACSPIPSRIPSHQSISP